ncbi:MAG: TauC [Chthonomonadaceae bacterium]|nr:TauC [Chthonomonadaceae bacterium]
MVTPIVFFILILILWETGYRREWWNGYLFPGPSQVVQALVAGIRDHSLIIATRISLVRLVLAFSTALVLGTLLGILNGTVPVVRRAIGPLALGLQTLPSICWLPLAIIWFGLSERAILFVTLMGALLAVTIAVSDGIRNIPPIYLRAAKMMGARGPRLYREVLIPAAFPAIITGAKQGWAFAWRSLMAGELLSVSTGALGLGQTLMRGRDLNDMSQVLAVMTILIVIGVVADRLIFTQLEDRVRRRWGLANA